MKDRHDKQTGDLLASPNARRQAAFKERQKAAGLHQRSYWLTDAEAEAVAQLIERLRRAG